MHSKCIYIIGFDIHDNKLRETFVENIKDEFKAEMINQSCYKTDYDSSISIMQDRLSTICKLCVTNDSKFEVDDFVKLYCSAYQADYNTEYKHVIYEYYIELQK